MQQQQSIIQCIALFCRQAGGQASMTDEMEQVWVRWSFKECRSQSGTGGEGGDRTDWKSTERGRAVL